MEKAIQYLFIFLKRVSKWSWAVNPLNVNPSLNTRVSGAGPYMGELNAGTWRGLSSPWQWELWASNIPLLLTLETDYSSASLH